MRVDLVLGADYAETYIAKLVADTLGPDATIEVEYSPPDDDGLVAVIGTAHS